MNVEACSYLGKIGAFRYFCDKVVTYLPAVDGRPLRDDRCPYTLWEAVDRHCMILNRSVFSNENTRFLEGETTNHPENRLAKKMENIGGVNWKRERLKDKKVLSLYRLPTVLMTLRNLREYDPNTPYNYNRDMIIPEAAQLALYTKSFQQGKLEAFDPTLREVNIGDLVQAFQVVGAVMEKRPDLDSLFKIFEFIDKKVRQP